MTSYWNRGELAYYESQVQGYQGNAQVARVHLAQLASDQEVQHTNWQRQMEEWEALEPDVGGGKPAPPAEPIPPIALPPELPQPPDPPQPYEGRQVEELEELATLHGPAIVLPGFYVLSRGEVSFAIGETDLVNGYTTEAPAAPATPAQTT